MQIVLCYNSAIPLTKIYIYVNRRKFKPLESILYTSLRNGADSSKQEAHT